VITFPKKIPTFASTTKNQYIILTMKKPLIYLSLLILALSSCRQQKELIYFTDLQEANIPNNTLQEQKSYLIRANDILYVKVMSLDEKINAQYNAAATGGSAMTGRMYSEDAMFFTGYSVQDNGAIDLPVFGEIQVLGLTIQDAKKAIIEKTEEFLKDVEVIVKLANFKVTLLGEVNRPGIYNYYNNQTTILEALGKAGDLSDYGNRKEVLVIRPTVEGSKSFRLNLQDKDLLSSPKYFIQPNDVIYVPPLKAKGTRLLAQDYGIFITSISSTLTAVSLIVTIILNFKN
jgi:polysaccharide biosynthesis/export protein